MRETVGGGAGRGGGEENCFVTSGVKESERDARCGRREREEGGQREGGRERDAGGMEGSDVSASSDVPFLP